MEFDMLWVQRAAGGEFSTASDAGLTLVRFQSKYSIAVPGPPTMQGQGRAADRKYASCDKGE